MKQGKTPTATPALINDPFTTTIDIDLSGNKTADLAARNQPGSVSKILLRSSPGRLRIVKVITTVFNE